MKATRYAVKTDKGYIRRAGSSYFKEVEFEKADLYLTEKQAKLSADRHKGKVVVVTCEGVERIMEDEIIYVKFLLSNGRNWVLTKEFIHSLQQKHDRIIIHIKDPQNKSFAQLIYRELDSNKDLKVESFSINRAIGEEKFPMYNTIEATTNVDKYTIQLIKDI